MKCATVERQKSVSALKKGDGPIGTCVRKRCWFMLLFLHCFTHKKNVYPFHKHNEQLNCLYPWRPKVQQATWLLWSCMTARLKTINTRSERTQKGRNEVRSPQPNVTLQYQYIFKSNKDKYMFKMHLQLCRIKEKTFSQQGFFFFGSNQMLKNICRQMSEEHSNGVQTLDDWPVSL